MNVAREGDDAPEPIRVYLYGEGFCSIDGELAARAAPATSSQAACWQTCSRFGTSPLPKAAR